MKIGRSTIKRYRTCQHCFHSFPTTEQAVEPKRRRKKKDEEDIYIIEDE